MDLGREGSKGFGKGHIWPFGEGNDLRSETDLTDSEYKFKNKK